MIWKKPPEYKYTDLCKFVDHNMNQLGDPDCPQELQDKIYNYLWLLVKALAIKKRMFNAFQDYDGYAFYAANRLFFAIKKNLENQGKVIRGKEIKPIKSCLNYTKTLLYPMKVDYLKEEYNSDIHDFETAKNFDAFMMRQKVKENVWRNQGGAEEFSATITDIFVHFNQTLDGVLSKSPFAPGTPDYKKIKISVLMNVLANLKAGVGLNAERTTILLWKLPKSMGNYVKIFIRELGIDLKQNIMSSYTDSLIDDRILKCMLANPEGEFIDHES